MNVLIYTRTARKGCVLHTQQTVQYTYLRDTRIVVTCNRFRFWFHATMTGHATGTNAACVRGTRSPAHDHWNPVSFFSFSFRRRCGRPLDCRNETQSECQLPARFVPRVLLLCFAFARNDGSECSKTIANYDGKNVPRCSVVGRNICLVTIISRKSITFGWR